MELTVLLIGAVVYLLPCGIAYQRKAGAANGIMVLNVLLGWTGLGWIGALVWAIAAPAPVQEDGRAEEKRCPQCAEWIQAQALVCKHCGSRELVVSAPLTPVAADNLDMGKLRPCEDEFAKWQREQAGSR